MWISRKKWNEMQNKIADLEEQVQSQQKIMKSHMNEHEKSVEELKEIVLDIKNHIGRQQVL